jgi:hypothetical protein
MPQRNPNIRSKERINEFKRQTEEYIRHLEQENLSLKRENQWLRQSYGLQPVCQQPAIEFVFETPNAQPAKIVSPPKKTQDPDVQHFLNSLPKTEEQFRSRRKAANLFEAEEIVETFLLFTGFTGSPSKDIEGKPIREATVSRVFQVYGSFASSSLRRTIHVNQTSNYIVLIFLFLGRVALHEGVDKQTVVEHTLQCLIDEQGKSNADAKYIENLLNTIPRWLVGQIAPLSSRGLQHRSWELIVLCAKPEICLIDY